MKSLLKALILVLIATTAALAQPGQSLERIHAAKMAYITDRLHLTITQSQNFMPVYNEYELEIRGIRQMFRKQFYSSENNNADDAAARRYIDDNLDYQQQILDLKRKYNERFLKIISSQQLATLYQSEREFRQILLQRLKQQHGGRMNARGY